MNSPLPQTGTWVADRAPALICRLAACAILLAGGEAVFGAAPPAPPNVILILTDDERYGDLQPFYPATGVESPHFDRLAAEGMRFSDFYVGSAVCSPSRAALMTGCYPQRVGLPAVLEADSNIGLNRDEKTLPELLKAGGYRTCCIGKWHLGDGVPQVMPEKKDYFQSRRLYRIRGEGQRPPGVATTPPRSWLSE